jgi:hypothetical protein
VSLALSLHLKKGAVAFHAKFQRWPLGIEPFGPKKDTCAGIRIGSCRELWRKSDLALGVVDCADAERSAGFLSPLRTDSLPLVSKIYWRQSADDAIMYAP